MMVLSILSYSFRKSTKITRTSLLYSHLFWNNCMITMIFTCYASIRIDCSLTLLSPVVLIYLRYNMIITYKLYLIALFPYSYCRLACRLLHELGKYMPFSNPPIKFSFFILLLLSSRYSISWNYLHTLILPIEGRLTPGSWWFSSLLICCTISSYAGVWLGIIIGLTISICKCVYQIFTNN